MKESTNRSNFAPEGWQAVTPRLVVRDAKQLVEFLKQVFEATGEYRTERPSVITIGDSMLMVSDAGVRSPMPALLYVHIFDPDAIYQRAFDAWVSTLEA